MPLIIIGIIFVTGLFIFYIFSAGSGKEGSKADMPSKSPEDSPLYLVEHKDINDTENNFSENKKEKLDDN
ncbi:MAG: hypothetical protein SOR72_03940 [Hornefia sp.]|nr:hypothetical protein [Hornefia sp.]